MNVANISAWSTAYITRARAVFLSLVDSPQTFRKMMAHVQLQLLGLLSFLALSQAANGSFTPAHYAPRASPRISDPGLC